MTTTKFVKHVNSIFEKHIIDAVHEYIEFAKQNKMCIVKNDFDYEDIINSKTMTPNINNIDFSTAWYDLDLHDKYFDEDDVLTENDVKRYIKEQIKEEKEAKAEQERKDLETYKRLKKKFENKI